MIDNQLRPVFLAADQWIDNYIRQTHGYAKSLAQYPDFNLNKAFQRDTLSIQLRHVALCPDTLATSPQNR